LLWVSSRRYVTVIFRIVNLQISSIVTRCEHKYSALAFSCSGIHQTAAATMVRDLLSIIQQGGARRRRFVLQMHQTGRSLKQQFALSITRDENYILLVAITRCCSVSLCKTLIRLWLGFVCCCDCRGAYGIYRTMHFFDVVFDLVDSTCRHGVIPRTEELHQLPASGGGELLPKSRHVEREQLQHHSQVKTRNRRVAPNITERCEVKLVKKSIYRKSGFYDE
jgi:hypothetical protein